MILACSSCAKPIDVQPPACRACGRRQPEPGDALRRRLGWTGAVFAACALAGLAYGVELRVAGLKGRIQARFGGGPVADAQKEALRARLRELVARLRADREAPYADLEDVLLEPGRFAPGGVSLVAYLFSVKTPGANSGRLSVGWGHGAMLDLDLSALPRERRLAAVGLTGKPHFVLARWRVSLGAGDPVLRVESLEELGEPRGVETVPELLGE